MRKHLSVTALLAAVLGLSTFAAGQKQLDIALEGPWILFTDKLDGNNILIAVAPIDATDTDPIDEEGHFHHPPQLSSGNGFYLPTPSASSPGIFCLAFDRCAPNAGSTFTYDPSYPPEQILTLTGNNSNKQWRSYGAKNDVVILPMPNSYHLYHRSYAALFLGSCLQAQAIFLSDNGVVSHRLQEPNPGRPRQSDRSHQHRDDTIADARPGYD
jgi:hypothetical protein